MVTVLAQFNNEQWPIRGTVTKTVADFRRTHLDTWEFQKLLFSEDQLEVVLSTALYRFAHLFVFSSFWSS